MIRPITHLLVLGLLASSACMASAAGTESEVDAIQGGEVDSKDPAVGLLQMTTRGACRRAQVR